MDGSRIALGGRASRAREVGVAMLPQIAPETAESAFRAGVTIGGYGRVKKIFGGPWQMAEGSAIR